MDFRDIIENDFRTIEETEFWRVFLAAIEKARNSAMNELCSARQEDVAKLQGRIFAYKLVLGLPKKIVEDSKATTPNGAANGVTS